MSVPSCARNVTCARAGGKVSGSCGSAGGHAYATLRSLAYAFYLKPCTHGDEHTRCAHFAHNGRQLALTCNICKRDVLWPYHVCARARVRNVGEISRCSSRTHMLNLHCREREWQRSACTVVPHNVQLPNYMCRNCAHKKERQRTALRQRPTHMRSPMAHAIGLSGMSHE